ncbi:tRNA lysidine(34) synthetase TilS [Halanaerobium praevalens]|uniref:tRNA(Ile)-lysidine synthase n=1 Tax=Halanaerobium praevalens (strain ATCC 33744 / DSM 2228 / GSL) TaxID=572479 RepID=E3DQ80_HALPG|nr:tRNA lysidine(34) synthetase TilS [Halanaerobium praevalens]ADO77857.1 tRNA(Ile)-lysidine synthetase [Halanaerobium praevalens DSM 2228]
MKARFKEFIQKNNLLLNSSRILLAVSGGPDSLAMLDLFDKLKEELKIEIAVAHLDHMFRKESKSEADFIERFAKKRGIQFFSKRVNLPQIIKTNKVSAEAAARQERFTFFKNIIAKENFDLLALAHHKGDQAETVLLNLFRGCGLKGLGGIELQAKFKELELIHPMLIFTKKEILAYCQQQKLSPSFDSSNQENIYSRNIIRNEILPLIEKKINPKVKEVIAKNSKLIASEAEFLEKLAKKKYKELLVKEKSTKIIIDFNSLLALDQVIQRRIYRQIYKRLNNNLDDLYLEHIFEIEKLIADKKTGRGVDIASGIRVEISYSNLIFSKGSQSKQKLENKIKINLGQKIKINKKYSLKAKVVNEKDFAFVSDPKRAAFDYEKIDGPLFIRNRKAGDKLRPLGMKGQKKIKDILIDAKVPKYQRDQVPVIVDGNDNLLWLAPYKLSDKFKVTVKTDKILILELEYN